tara:strand:+ start:281 stop:1534 length:1254 start_codon:yes stop_codon:yes gene_type:complete
MEKKINFIDIDTRVLPQIAQNRILNITGEQGANFNINIIKINGTSKETYYNFITKQFTEKFISANNLNVNLKTNSFSKLINFPADSTGDIYRIIVFAGENSVFINGSYVNVKNITQAGQATVIIQADPGADRANYYTASPPAPTVSVTGSTAKTTSTDAIVDWTLTNASSNTYGFGLMLPSLVSTFSILDDYWYVEQAQVTDGAVTSSTSIVFSSTTNLYVGMELVSFNSGSVSGTPLIEAIDGNRVILSVAQTVGDSVTATFRAYGKSLITNAFNINVDFIGFTATGVQLEKSIRSDVTQPTSDVLLTYNLNGTHGISGGSLIRMTGFNINANGNNNLIISVAASAAQGSVSMEYNGATDQDITEAKVVTAGTKVQIIGCHQVIKVQGTVRINTFPDQNRKIYLDLNKFITVGAAS